MFKKGDYIVLLNLDYNGDSSFPINYIYKQRQEQDYLQSELDNRGNETNGWSRITFNKRGYNCNWRYATQQEINKYNELGKPFDVSLVNLNVENDLIYY